MEFIQTTNVRSGQIRSLLNFPDDLLVYLLTFLSSRDLFSFLTSCRRFAALQKEIIWLSKIVVKREQDFKILNQQRWLKEANIHHCGNILQYISKLPSRVNLFESSLFTLSFEPYLSFHFHCNIQHLSLSNSQIDGKWNLFPELISVQIRGGVNYVNLIGLEECQKLEQLSIWENTSFISLLNYKCFRLPNLTHLSVGGAIEEGWTVNSPRLRLIEAINKPANLSIFPRCKFKQLHFSGIQGQPQRI